MYFSLKFLSKKKYIFSLTFTVVQVFILSSAPLLLTFVLPGIIAVPSVFYVLFLSPLYVYDFSDLEKWSSAIFLKLSSCCNSSYFRSLKVSEEGLHIYVYIYFKTFFLMSFSHVPINSCPPVSWITTHFVFLGFFWPCYIAAFSYFPYLTLFLSLILNFLFIILNSKNTIL